MSISPLLKDINEDVKDIINRGFEIPTILSDIVPSDEDPGLTFEVGKSKKGKILKTCVLHVDIRNSTDLNIKYDKKKIGQLYSAFIKSAISVAEHHNGVVRHIIGDRLMIVFNPKNCFKDAIETAISLNTVAHKIIDTHFKIADFKVGIGIDFGEMLVLKVGIPKQGKERNSYKSLIWLGLPANIASKLTDFANKTIKKKTFSVRFWHDPVGGLKEIIAGTLSRLSPYWKEEEITADNLIERIGWSHDNVMSIDNGKVANLSKKDTELNYPQILITEAVYNGINHALPERDFIKDKHLSLQNLKINGYNGKIYGMGSIWKVEI